MCTIEGKTAVVVVASYSSFFKKSRSFGGVDKKCFYTRITFSHFLAYEGVILMQVIITQYKVLFK